MRPGHSIGRKWSLYPRAIVCLQLTFEFFIWFLSWGQPGSGKVEALAKRWQTNQKLFVYSVFSHNRVRSWKHVWRDVYSCANTGKMARMKYPGTNKARCVPEKKKKFNMSKGMKTQQLAKMPKSSVISPVFISLRRYREIFGDSDEEVLHTVYQCILSSVFCLCGYTSFSLIEFDCLLIFWFPWVVGRRILWLSSRGTGS